MGFHDSRRQLQRSPLLLPVGAVVAIGRHVLRCVELGAEFLAGGRLRNHDRALGRVELPQYADLLDRLGALCKDLGAGALVVFAAHLMLHSVYGGGAVSCTKRITLSLNSSRLPSCGDALIIGVGWAVLSGLPARIDTTQVATPIPPRAS